MPRVLRFLSYDLYIYYKDHGQPHVHITGHGAEAKILIGNSGVVRSKGFKKKEIAIITEFIKRNRDDLLRIYEEIQEN